MRVQSLFLVLLPFTFYLLPFTFAYAQESEIKSSEAEELAVAGNVSLDFKDADIKSVLRIISYKSGVNIVATPEVMGAVTIKLKDVPWEKALATILRTYGFAYEWISDEVIMVSTLEKLAEQRNIQQEAAEKEPLDTKTFVLNFTKAEEVKATIENLISERGRIALEPRTNILIITDTKSNLIKIGEVIKRLDRITPQVMIEAKIIETALGDAEKLGIDWSMRIAASGSARPTTFPFTSEIKGTGTKMFPKVKVPSELDRVDTTVTDSTGNVTTTTEEKMWHKLVPGFPSVCPGEFLFGTLDFSGFQAVLEVLDSSVDTKIIANPRITTLNNQEAKIFVGEVVPIPTYTYSKESGTQIISGYKDQEIGIKLVVTPNINEQNYITLSINPSIEQIIGSTGPDGERPIYSTRSAETKVMIKDGQTLVIGGLISESKIKYRKKVPILGDIPLLGLLFSKKEDTVTRTDLLIFITPHIIEEAKLGPEEIVKR